MPPDDRVKAFRRWLTTRGREEETAEVYGYLVAKALRAPEITEPLLDRQSAPKSRRVMKAALKSWAKYTKDAELEEILGEIKLPPAIRQKPKHPLSLPDLRKYVQTLEGSRLFPPSRLVIETMIRRGLRIRDVLKIQKDDIRTAIRTGTLTYEQKGSRRREIDAAPILEQLRGFAEEGGKDWNRVADLFVGASIKAATQRVRRAAQRVAKKAKIEGVHPHQFRRTHAMNFLTRLENDPQALTKLQQYMGWTNISTAAMYTDNVNRAELDKLGADMMKDLLP